MVPARRPFVGGNWKMNTLRASAVELAQAIRRACDAPLPAPGGATEGAARCANGPERAEVVLFPPVPYLRDVAGVLAGSAIGVGAQDLSAEERGAFTGQVSAEMIRDSGGEWVIIGHSERRHGAGESDELCGRKLTRALGSELRTIFCVGETWEERSAGKAHEVNRRQLEAGFREVGAERLGEVVVAYEPVWAIGTGKTASASDAQEAHRSIREWLANRYDLRSASGVRILYGGSVNAANAAALFSEEDIDGGLIGGASLKAADFLAIVAACGATAKVER
ncbi:MAG: triose-phosphate isomerase [Phycisphaeraceae bacterium]|nr:triose-phosphate isomerase [Phycisphaeraceae bacterium]